MRLRLQSSVLVLSMLVPCASALPQAVNSAQQPALKSTSQSPEWTEADERAFLAKALQGDAGSQMWLACGYDRAGLEKPTFPQR
jgi:hypothetical protein